MGKIKFHLLRNKWITPSSQTSRLLFSVVKRDGIDPIWKAIKHLEKEGYSPRVVNDLSSKITILYLSSLTKQLPTDEKGSEQAKQILDELIKDVLDD